MNRRGRLRKASGTIFKRAQSAYWWARYPDNEGGIKKESTGTMDREEAERFLRDRLNARDKGKLTTVLAGKSLLFNDWVNWFLERRSEPPFRAEKTHAANMNALKFLRPVFGDLPIVDITAESIKDYINQKLELERRIQTKFGVQHRGKLKPGTVHQEFRIFRRILNVAVKQKRLAVNPCQTVEFPVLVARSLRKPHYMTASEQARIEFAAPSYLRCIVVIMSEMGLSHTESFCPCANPMSI